MLIITNESTLSNIEIKKEINKALSIMPVEVKDILNEDNMRLEIIYIDDTENVEFDIEFYGDEIYLDNTLGLFDYADNHLNSYRIYICVKNHTNSIRFNTLVHELGHFVDYMIGYYLSYSALTGYHHYSASSKNNFFDIHSKEILSILKELSDGYYEVWDYKKTEQFAEFFALFVMNKVGNYEVTNAFDKYLSDVLSAAVYSMNFFKTETKLSFSEKVYNKYLRLKNMIKSNYSNNFKVYL